MKTRTALTSWARFFVLSWMVRGGRLQIHFHCLTGRAVRDAFCPRQNATRVDVFGAAGGFAGFVQFLLLNKNCTRAGGLQIVCRLLLISRAVRNAFCLSAKCYAGRYG